MIVPEIIIVIYIFFIQFLLWPYAVYLSKKEIFKNQILNLFIIAVLTTLGFILFLCKRPASHILKVPAVILFPVSKDAAGENRFQRQEWC